jgi:hypothetical protein
MRNETVDETPEPASELPAVIPSGAVGQALPPEEIKAPVTAAQAKVNAIAELTMSAYQKAGTLELTPEDSAALQEPFPDEAFQPGAAGKENLIYIEHSALRDRLNKVLGLGQWSIIPRNRWAEPFKFFSKWDKTQREGTRIYVEAMLVVRGAFVAEAVGSMDYYPNDATNYGDAVEGAKTSALRRCCKEFGIGLQAWSKDWCEGWWLRRRQGARKAASPAARPAQPAATAPAPQTAHPAPPARPAPAPAAHAPTPESPERKLARWIQLMRQAATNHDEYAVEVLVDHDILMPNESLEDYPIEKLPSTRRVAEALLEEISARAGAAPTAPYAPPPPERPAAAPRPALKAQPPAQEEAWRAFPMPWGKNAGTLLGNLEKGYLFGLWANWHPQTEYGGRPVAPERLAKDQQFRDMLDEAGKHYNFQIRGEVDNQTDPEPEPSSMPSSSGVSQPEEDDDVQF